MSEPLRASVLNLPEAAFPVEIFGYPEGSSPDAAPIWHAVVRDPEQRLGSNNPLPKGRMRMKIVCANGVVFEGEERQE